VIVIPRKDKTTEETKALWFNIICGAVFSIIALISIIVLTIMYGITSIAGFLIGVIFWSFYLLGSIFLMWWGTYTKNREKNGKGKKKLRPPIVS